MTYSDIPTTIEASCEHQNGHQTAQAEAFGFILSEFTCEDCGKVASYSISRLAWHEDRLFGGEGFLLDHPVALLRVGGEPPFYY